MCRYFKEEEWQEKGQRGMKGSDLFVGLWIHLSGQRTVLLGDGHWALGPGGRMWGRGTGEDPCRAC